MTGILFDARWIMPGMTGVGRVALELLRGIPPAARSPIGIILTGSEIAPGLEGFRIHRTRISLTNHPLTDLYEQLMIPVLCYRHGYKAFISFEGRLPVWHAGFRTYGYLHDATFITRWRHNGWKYTTFLRAHLTAMRLFATGIITVSHDAKARLLPAAGLRGEKVFVVPNADSVLDRALPSRPRDLTGRPYVLAVGMTNARKNFPGLVRAFALFNRDDAHDLVVTGSRATLESLLQGGLPDGLPGDRIRFPGFVTDGELRHLYEHAACLAYPSFEEGFGIPLLDAGFRGTAIACSDLAVFREVIGDGATYFDPHDPASMARALRKAVDSGVKADPAVLRARFSWERSARTLLAVAGTPSPNELP